MLWTFFFLALPITLGSVICTIFHYASPKVLPHVRIVVAYAWFVNVSIVILTPVDVWTTVCLGNGNPQSECGSTLPIGVMWSFAYWSAYFLTWLIIPIMQGYEDSGDFTVRDRLWTSIRGNLILIAVVGSLAVVGVIALVASGKMSWDTILKLAIGASNAFALITGALLLGFGLVEIPRGIWRHSELHERSRWLSHRVAKTAQKLDQAHQELSTAIVITQATSLQMPRKDPLRPMMDIIEAMATEDSSFKPSGGQIGENDMDYDADLRSMAALRRRLRNAQDNYSRYKTEYCRVIWEAMELEDTLYNCQEPNGKRFLSSLRPPRTGHLAPLFDMAEWWWRCVLWANIARAISIVLGLTSVAILLAEVTLLWKAEELDLSLFSQLVTAIGMQAELVQLFVFLPLVYLCVCTYFSLFKLGMFSFYYLLPGDTNSISLLMNCSMVSRYAAPMCYNFLRLIHLSHYDPHTRSMVPLLTVFEKSMKGLPDYFERMYPLCIIAAAGLIAANVHQRIAKALGSAWRRFKFETDDDFDDFGPGPGSSSNLLGMAPNSPMQCSTAGLAILKKERVNLGQGLGLAEHVLPLARNFTAVELETGILEGSPLMGTINGAMPHLAFTLVSTFSPKVGPKTGHAVQAAAGLMRRSSPSHVPETVPEDPEPLDIHSSQSAVPSRQMMASLYETLLKATSGFASSTPANKGREEGALLKEDAAGASSQPNSVPGSPELPKHAWTQQPSHSESNLLAAEKKSLSAHKEWPRRGALFGNVEKGKNGFFSASENQPPDLNGVKLPSSISSYSQKSGTAEDIARAGSGGWGTAVKLRWKDLTDTFKTGKLESVLRTASTGSLQPRQHMDHQSLEIPASPTTPPRAQLPSLDRAFETMNSRRNREGYGSEEDDDFQRYMSERTTQSRPFF